MFQDLTVKEKEIVKMLCKDNLTVKEISNTLCIEESTIRTHLNNIFQKTLTNNQKDLMWHYYNEVK